jgi:hypothetical protein
MDEHLRILGPYGRKLALLWRRRDRKRGRQRFVQSYDKRPSDERKARTRAILVRRRL